MQIVNFNFLKISAERFQKPVQGMKINSDINLVDIKKEKLDLPEGQNKDHELLHFEFSYDIKYEEKVALISFKGVILIIFSKEQADEILKQWNDKKLPDEIRVPLFNFIFSKCNSRALRYEEELALPYHVPMPQLTLESKDTKEADSKIKLKDHKGGKEDSSVTKKASHT